LVVASAFIEGTTSDGLNKPYLIYLRKHPFAFAGIWDSWKNQENEVPLYSFSIITITANEILQKIPHPRMPVILPEEQYNTWLNNTSDLGHITGLLRPYPARMMNAYPISPDIKNPKNNSKELLNPLGDRLFPEFEIKFTSELEKKGFGKGKNN
jgi:putative SOS response-associated peptidase YedK